MAATLEMLEGRRSRLFELAIATREERDYNAFRQADIELDEARGEAFAGKTWSRDGRRVIRSRWCECGNSAVGMGAEGGEVEYTAYDLMGRATAHGFCCESCRAITQVG